MAVQLGVSNQLHDYLNFLPVGQVWCIRRRVFDGNKRTKPEEMVYGITDFTPLLTINFKSRLAKTLACSTRI